MRINPIKTNMTELELREDLFILFSYKTPVAYLAAGQARKTKKKWSTTTSRHINQWFKMYGVNPKSVVELDQSILDHMVTGVTI